MSVSTNNLLVLTPVFNDWKAAAQLKKEVVALLSKNYIVRFCFVDDFSTNSSNFEVEELLKQKDEIIEIVRLKRNFGHQRAISIGLAYLASIHGVDSDSILVVMDCDGEDRPCDIAKLLTNDAHNDKIVFAGRNKRSESVFFKVGYYFYKIIYAVLTGKRISFGNFCAIPYRYLTAITSMSESFIHFSGALVRSKIPYLVVETERGRRYDGKSKMNFIDLFIHGMSSVAVFGDIVAARVLIGTFGLMFVAMLALLIVIFLRLFTSLAIPGWATNAGLMLTLVLLQSFLMSLLMLLGFVVFRAQNSFVPARDFKDFIHSVKSNK